MGILYKTINSSLKCLNHNENGQKDFQEEKTTLEFYTQIVLLCN